MAAWAAGLASVMGQTSPTAVAAEPLGAAAGAGSETVIRMAPASRRRIFEPRHRPRHRSGYGYFLGGSITGGCLWGVTAINGVLLASVGHQPDALWLLVPVAGPFLFGSTTNAWSNEGGALVAAVGMVQGVALIMMVVGLIEMATSSAPEEPEAASARSSISTVLAPDLLGLTGRF